MRQETGFLLAWSHLNLIAVITDGTSAARSGTTHLSLSDWRERGNPQHFASSSQAVGRILTLAYEHPATTTHSVPVSFPHTQRSLPSRSSSSISSQALHSPRPRHALHRPLIPLSFPPFSSLPLKCTSRQRCTSRANLSVCSPACTTFRHSCVTT